MSSRLLGVAWLAACAGCGIFAVPPEPVEPPEDAGPVDAKVEGPREAPRCGEPGRACSDFASCCSGTCTAGKCAEVEACGAEPKVIASIPHDASGDVAQSPTRIFYLRANEVWAVAKNGGAPALYAAPKETIRGIASDGGSLYWTSAGGGVVIAPFDGGAGWVATEKHYVLESSESVVSGPWVFAGYAHWIVNYWDDEPYGRWDEHSILRTSTSSRDDDDPESDLGSAGASIRLTGDARWLYWLDGGSPAVSVSSYLVRWRERLDIHGDTFSDTMWVSPGPILAAEGGVYFFYGGSTWYGRPAADAVAKKIGPLSAAASEAFTAHGAWLYLPTAGGVWRMHKADETRERITALDGYAIRSLVSDDTCLYAIGSAGKADTDVVLRMAIPAD